MVSIPGDDDRLNQLNPEIKKSPEKFLPIPEDVAYNPKLSPWAKLVYGIVAQAAKLPSRSTPTQEVIAQGLGCSVPTVERAFKELREAGLIAGVYHRRRPTTWKLLDPSPVTDQDEALDPSPVRGNPSPVMGQVAVGPSPVMAPYERTTEKKRRELNAPSPSAPARSERPPVSTSGPGAEGLPAHLRGSFRDFDPAPPGRKPKPAPEPAPPGRKRKVDPELRRRATAVLNAWWETQTPRPAQPWPACRGVVEKMLAAGHADEVVRKALDNAPVISTGALTFAINQAKGAGPSTNGRALRGKAAAEHRASMMAKPTSDNPSPEERERLTRIG